MWYELKENNNYLINTNGDIKSKKTNKILTPGKTTNGYYTVCLTKNGKCKSYYIHRLVANNLISNEKGYKEINHKDGNKQNNRVDNLEWCDRSYNLKHAYDKGLKKVPKGKDSPYSKKVLQRNILTGEIIIWDSMIDASRKKGYSTGAICGVCKGRNKTYKNSIWEYV